MWVRHRERQPPQMEACIRQRPSPSSLSRLVAESATQVQCMRRLLCVEAAPGHYTDTHNTRRRTLPSPTITSRRRRRCPWGQRETAHTQHTRVFARGAPTSFPWFFFPPLLRPFLLPVKQPAAVPLTFPFFFLCVRVSLSVRFTFLKKRRCVVDIRFLSEIFALCMSAVFSLLTPLLVIFFLLLFSAGVTGRGPDELWCIEKFLSERGLMMRQSHVPAALWPCGGCERFLLSFPAEACARDSPWPKRKTVETGGNSSSVVCVPLFECVTAWAA